jgi:hypothetical protein
MKDIESISTLLPKQAGSFDCRQKMKNLGSVKGEAVCPAGWLDILGRAAKGALGAVMS